MKKTRKQKLLEEEKKRQEEINTVGTLLQNTPDAVANKILQDVNNITDDDYKYKRYKYERYKDEHYTKSEGKQLRQIIIGKAYEQAIEYAYKQEFDFAVAILKTLTQLKPNLYFIHLFLAYNLLELQQTQQAIDEFNIAQQLGSTRATQWLQGDHIATSCQAILQDIAKHCTPQELANKKGWTPKGTQNVLHKMRTTKLKPDPNNYLFTLGCYRDWNFHPEVSPSLEYKCPWSLALGLKVHKITIQNFDNADIIDTCYAEMWWCENYTEK
jgi:hypothetical protein